MRSSCKELASPADILRDASRVLAPLWARTRDAPLRMSAGEASKEQMWASGLHEALPKRQIEGIYYGIFRGGLYST